MRELSINLQGETEEIGGFRFTACFCRLRPRDLELEPGAHEAPVIP